MELLRSNGIYFRICIVQNIMQIIELNKITLTAVHPELRRYSNKENLCLNIRMSYENVI